MNIGWMVIRILMLFNLAKVKHVMLSLGGVHVEQTGQRLEAIWKSSMHTSEELLLDLKQWCHAASDSAIHMLNKFAKRLATLQLKHARV